MADTLIKPLIDVAAKGMEVLGSADAARIGVQVARTPPPALMADDSPTRLKGKATPGKRVAWGEPLPLDDVKAVSKA